MLRAQLSTLHRPSAEAGLALPCPLSIFYTSTEGSLQDALEMEMRLLPFCSSPALLPACFGDLPLAMLSDPSYAASIPLQFPPLYLQQALPTLSSTCIPIPSPSSLNTLASRLLPSGEDTASPAALSSEVCLFGYNKHYLTTQGQEQDEDPHALGLWPIISITLLSKLSCALVAPT